MDSLQNILGAKDFSPPDEITAVKNYIKRRYGSDCSVRLERDALIVAVPNSALAGTLRLEQQELIENCQLKKRLVIRIGRYTSTTF